MFLEYMSIGERLVTTFAYKRSILGVGGTFVARLCIEIGKLLPTVFTTVWLLARVRSLVPSQIELYAKCLLAEPKKTNESLYIYLPEFTSQFS